MAPATPRSSAVTGVPSTRVASTIRPSRARRSWMSVASARTAITSDATVIDELGLARDAVLAAAEAEDDVAQRPVADVEHARPQHRVRVDAERVLVVEAVVDERAGEVVGRPDRVDVAGQVEVEVLHRDDLAVAAAGGAALDPEHGPERRLADVDRRPVADLVEALGEPDGRRRLALAERRRRDRGDHDVLPARSLGLEARDRGEGHLGLRRSVQLELVGQDAQLGGDVDDRPRRDGTRDVEVGREAHRSPRAWRVSARRPGPVRSRLVRAVRRRG